MSSNTFHKLSNIRSWYKLHDVNPQDGARKINPREANKLNGEGYGIFWTNNLFDGERKKENLVQILSWAVELDDGTKEEQRERIEKFPMPSTVIETKRGFHVYYDAINADQTPDEYRNFLLDHFIPNLNADAKAADVCRILRVPCLYHMKDPSNPFFVKLVSADDVVYTKSDIENYFPKKYEAQEHRQSLKHDLKFQADDDLWFRIYSMNQMAALERVSGHSCVNGETYGFRRVGGDKYNVLVNNKGTSCWIDQSRKIGSSDHGGPTVWQWINYFQKDHKRTYGFMKEIFPEVFA